MPSLRSYLDENIIIKILIFFLFQIWLLIASGAIVLSRRMATYNNKDVNHLAFQDTVISNPPVNNNFPILQAMPPDHLMFDLDNTLVAIPEYIYKCYRKKFFSKPQIAILTRDKTAKRHYMINPLQMREIFIALRRKKIKIGFITNGIFSKNILSELSLAYKLPKRFFKKCVFIDRNTYCGHNKAEKIIIAKQCGKINPDANVLVVDDHPENIEELKASGFAAIHACGCPDPTISKNKATINNEYLTELIRACNLGSRLLARINDLDVHQPIVGSGLLYHHVDPELVTEILGKHFVRLKGLREFLEEGLFNVRDLTERNYNGFTPLSLANRLASKGNNRHPVGHISRDIKVRLQKLVPN